MLFFFSFLVYSLFLKCLLRCGALNECAVLGRGVTSGWGPGECWERSCMDTRPIVILHLQLIWAVLWCAPGTTSAAAMPMVWEASSSPLLACWPCTNLVLVEPGEPCIGGFPISLRSIQECMWLFLGRLFLSLPGDTVLFVFTKALLKSKILTTPKTAFLLSATFVTLRTLNWTILLKRVAAQLLLQWFQSGSPCSRGRRTWA